MFSRFKKYFAMLFVSLSLAGVIFPAVVSTTVCFRESMSSELNQKKLRKAAAVFSSYFMKTEK